MRAKGVIKMKKIKVIVPVSTDMWNEPVKKEMEKYKDTDTRIDIINIEKGPESLECTYDEAWSELFTVQEAEKAEREGYDGVIIYCFGDPGLRAAKEKLDIPVVGINEPSIHIASLLGDKFSIISVGPAGPGITIEGLMKDKMKLYGFEHKCTSVRSIGIPVLDLGKEKRREAERVFEEAKKAVEEDGADTIVLGCGSILGAEGRILKELKVPVVIPGVAALKICENLICMGIAQSKRYFATPPEKKRLL
ncbi:Hydantoin racemase [subsurface metagenome]|jgi:allantoin racemase